MSLYKLTLDCERGHARTVCALLEEAVDPPPLAVSQFEVPGTPHWRVEAYCASQAAAEAVAAALADLAVARSIAVTPAVEAVPDENWVALSQAALPPVEAGRFLVHGSHDRARARGRHLAIEIDAGEAFGTAHHATTEGCLLAIDRLLRRRHFARVLDLGTGSGVLAIAVALADPHASVLASDIDARACEVAAGNCRGNGVAARVRVVEAVGLAHARLRNDAAFDLILANILAEPLRAMAPALARRLAPSGSLVLSGILVRQAPEVIAAYRAAGLTLVRHDRLAGWSTLTFGR
ncbi:MAG: 50S ribosomal protein L11 methyltransferase [Hyphomicrobiaceae bacterium]